MRAVLLLVAHELRIRWRGWAVLVLLVGLAGGAVMTAAAGARRTSSAYPRFLRASHASDLLVSVAGIGTTGFYGALARQPGVALLARGIGLNVQPADRAGRLDWAATTEAPAGRLLGHGLDAPRVLAGRLPRLDRAGEIAVDQTAAAALHLRVGSTLAMEALSNQGQPGSGTGSGPAVPPRRLRERVVGIVVTRSSVDPVTDNDKVAFIQASPALTQQLGPGYRAFDGAFVKLDPGATASLVSREAQALARRFPATLGQAYVDDESAQVATIERGIRPETIALAIFALALACTALLIVGQAATRLLLAAGADNPVLAALGLTRGQMVAAALIEIVVAGTAGAILAAGVAVAASPLMPIGAARLAEPDPGVSADWLVLSAGAVIIVVLLAARTLWPAWRLASVRETAAREAAMGPGRRSWLAGWLAGAGAPVTMTAGARLATEPGRGAAAVPVRAALAGTALSVLAVTAAFTFGANLLHLVHSPRLYGQSLGRRDRSAVLAYPAGPGPEPVRHHPGHHRLDLRRSRHHRDQRPPGPGDRPHSRPRAADLAHLGGRTPATHQPRDRAGFIHPARPGAARRASRCRSPSTGGRSRTGSSARPCSRTSARAASPRPTSARVLRPPPRCSARRPHCTGDAPGSRWCCCALPAAPAGVRPSPGSGAPWPGSAPTSSS